MTREIKFRAWSKRMQKMLYPTEISFNYDGLVTVYYGVDIDEKIKCDQNQVMQYTGLKDKNGVEIYEGDIFRVWDDDDNDCDEDKEIKFEEGQWWWGNDGGNSCPLFEVDTERFLIIGNIYQNPELLK
jgi:uncharacterized phage protein (TIGR01671 family)